MNDSIAPGAREFNTTRWSIVLAAQRCTDTTGARAGLAALCKDYWYPLYAFVRRHGFAAHNAIGDVNGRVFRSWLGPNEGEVPQGDSPLGDNVRIFVSGSAGWLNQNSGDSMAGLHDTHESANAGAEWKINSQWNEGDQSAPCKPKSKAMCTVA